MRDVVGAAPRARGPVLAWLGDRARALFSLGGYGGGSGGVPGSVGLSSRADAWLSAQESKEHSPRAAEGALGKANRSKKASPPLGQAVGAVKPSMTSAMAKLAPARLGRGWGAA
jgi:hypothetical protein